MTVSGARGPQESSWGPDFEMADRVAARRPAGFPQGKELGGEDVRDFETAALEGAVDRLQQGLAGTWNELDPNAFDWPPAGTGPSPVEPFDPWHAL